MLKSVKISGFVLAGLLLSGVVMAQSKVAVFNIQAAMMNTESAQSKVKALQTSAEYSQLKSKAEEIRTEVQKLTEEAQKNALTWSEDKKNEQQRKINSHRLDFETTVKKLRAMEEQVGKEIQKVSAPKAQTALKAIIDEQKLDLVLDAGVALYASPASDLTAEVVKRMNADKSTDK